jgi:hypothetical protein
MWGSAICLLLRKDWRGGGEENRYIPVSHACGYRHRVPKDVVEEAIGVGEHFM